MSSSKPAILPEKTIAARLSSKFSKQLENAKSYYSNSLLTSIIGDADYILSANCEYLTGIWRTGKNIPSLGGETRFIKRRVYILIASLHNRTIVIEGFIIVPAHERETPIHVFISKSGIDIYFYPIDKREYFCFYKNGVYSGYYSFEIKAGDIYIYCVHDKNTTLN